MKIAAAAYPMDWFNRWNEYIGKLRVWVRTAAENGADLLVFPEYGSFELASLAGEDNARDISRALEAVAARLKDVDELHNSLAREFAVHIAAASAPMAVDGRLVPRVRFFAPDGTMAHQDKQSLDAMELGAGMAAGQGGRVFDTALGAIGILPGRDAALPPLARALAAAGAELLLVPAGAPTPAAHARQRIMAAARAVENQVVVVQAVRVGAADWLTAAQTNSGTATILCPPGEGLAEDGVIATGKPNAPGWVYGDLDIEALRAARIRRAAADPTLWDDRAITPGPVETVRLGGLAPGAA